MEDVTNRDRCERARKALEVYSRELWCGSFANLEVMPEDDLEYTVVDMATDLLHFAGQHGMDTARILRCASEHYADEKAELIT